jgi:hypothetical protein
MPIPQAGSGVRNAGNFLRVIAFDNTLRPGASTPWTWNTFPIKFHGALQARGNLP